jgi:hypothetical protein
MTLLDLIFNLLFTVLFMGLMMGAFVAIVVGPTMLALRLKSDRLGILSIVYMLVMVGIVIPLFLVSW